MAEDEIENITEDKWDAEIWGVEHHEPDRKYNIPKLIFYFARNDHWVANHTRDALIAARARGEGEEQTGKPVMIVDKDGIEHGFCIRMFPLFFPHSNIDTIFSPPEDGY